MKKQYIVPTIRVKKINACELLAGSATTVTNSYSGSEQLSKPHIMWDDEEQVSNSNIIWDDEE